MSRTLLLLAVLLGGCDLPPVDRPLPAAPDPLPATAPLVVEEAVVADAPLPEAVEVIADDVQAPVLAAVEALDDLSPPVPVPEPEDAREAACREAAAKLIIRWEVSSEAWYNRALLHPIWPGGASGVTWGIGYDGGHQTATVIADDWQAHAERIRLARTAGITGRPAKRALPNYRDIETAFDYASQVFEERSLIEYTRRARRAFGDGFDLLHSNACAALVSLVYNRGASMSGDSRREMRALRDECVPEQDYACMAAQIRGMTRLWRGTVNEKGLTARREAEAILVLQP